MSTWSKDFAALCRGSAAIPSEEMVEIVRRAFIYRDNSELIGTERAGTPRFAQLLEDIPVPEGGVEVLRTLTNLFPNEAHIWAHLGRYLSRKLGRYADALECVEHALKIQETDHVLYHMLGMVYRHRLDALIENRGELDDVVGLAKLSSNAFTQARHFGPDDEHAYIGEVQMLITILNYAAQRHASGALGYVASNAADPFLREALERAEDLLASVRQTKEGDGPSSYEEDCRAKLDLLYGHYNTAITTWDALLHRQDVYAPPIRRQIVWTYLARRQRSWERLNEHEVTRIVELLEQNLHDEPYNNTTLRLWIQAVRRAKPAPSIEAVIERVAYWRANGGTIEAVYYLYVLYSLLAIEGFPIARQDAQRTLEECSKMARFRPKRTVSFEWYGRENGVRHLVHHSRLGEWSRNIDFWENTGPLARLRGRISKIESFQAGWIEVPGGLQAFFAPRRSGYHLGDENRPVTFYLGFSYDGLRAWQVEDMT